MSHGLRLLAASSIACMATMAVATSPALAEEAPSQSPNLAVEQAEPICAAYGEAFGRRWSPAPAFLKKPTPEREAKMLAWASEHLARVEIALEQIAWPPEDQAAVSRWLARMNRQASLLGRTSEAVGIPNRHLVRVLDGRMVRNGNLADAAATRLELHYCAGITGSLD